MKCLIPILATLMSFSLGEKTRLVLWPHPPLTQENFLLGSTSLAPLSASKVRTKGWLLYDNYASYLAGKSKSTIERFYFKSTTDRKEVALTFDDGTIPNSEAIVHYLAQNKIPTTYFLITDSLNQNNAKLYDSPYIEVGMHTHKHSDFRTFNRRQKANDLQESIRVFAEHQLPVKYFRPAYGIIDDEIGDLLDSAQVKGVIWSVDSHDWLGYSGAKLVSLVTSNIGPGSIILLHDRVSLATVKQLVKEINALGYTIAPLSELLKHKSEFPSFPIVKTDQR